MPGIPEAMSRLGAVIGACALLSAPALAQTARSDVPTDATQICPVLTGAPMPSVTVRDAAGNEVDLAARVARKPTLLLFYRGGWCPYCNRHLSAVQEVADELHAMGVRILALSPDRPGLLPGLVEKHGLGYELLSDSEMTAARAFGLAFRLDEAQYERLKGYGHDLEADSGQTHHELPVPAAFVVGTDGTILFSYVNPNYKTRVDAGVLLAAASAAVAERDDTP